MFSFQQGDFDDVKLKAKLCPLVSFLTVSVVLWNLIEKSFNEFALFKVIPLLKESNSKGYLSYDFQFFLYIYTQILLYLTCTWDLDAVIFVTVIFVCIKKLYLFYMLLYMKCTLINTMYIHFVVYLPLTKRGWIWVYSFPVWWECHLLYSLSCVPDTEGELSSMFDSRTLHWIQRGQRWNEILCTKFNGNWCNRFQMKL